MNNGLTYYISLHSIGVYIKIKYKDGDIDESKFITIEAFSKALKGDNDLSDKFFIAIKKALSELEGVNKIKDV